MALVIKTPDAYYNEKGVIKSAGEQISKYGSKAFVIAGRTAYDAAGDAFEASLDDRHIDMALRLMDGYPTYEKVVDYAQKSYTERADVVVGIGGGKICDVAKAVGNIRNIPIVQIPTVAATCACWAARSILYTDDGDFDRALWNGNNPNLILSDVDILKRAPKRYLAAGILDTLAKWYEFGPLIAKDAGDIVLKQDVAIAKLAFDILKEYGKAAYDGKASEDEFRQVLDAIFFLAGASGSFVNGKAYRGFAHSYYYASTRIAESRHLLHGERVAFGLLVQFILAKKPNEYIDDFVNKLIAYNITETPADWNIDEKHTAERLARLIITESPIVVEKGYVSTEDECAEAIVEASRLLRERRG